MPRHFFLVMNRVSDRVEEPRIRFTEANDGAVDFISICMTPRYVCRGLKNEQCAREQVWQSTDAQMRLRRGFTKALPTDGRTNGKSLL